MRVWSWEISVFETFVLPFWFVCDRSVTSLHHPVRHPTRFLKPQSSISCGILSSLLRSHCGQYFKGRIGFDHCEVHTDIRRHSRSPNGNRGIRQAEFFKKRIKLFSASKRSSVRKTDAEGFRKLLNGNKQFLLPSRFPTFQTHLKNPMKKKVGEI